MSFKTDRLVALFPDVYAAHEDGSLLYTVLDALGAELMQADAAIKDLLKSHWIDYARGGGLDGLGALLGVARRLLPNGTPEGDDTFRPLVKSTVSSFIGGGTVDAVKGAVRAALGLPYDLALFRQQLESRSGTSSATDALIAGLAQLVQVEEFAPKLEVVLGSSLPTVGGSTATLNLDFSSVEPMPPRIEWTFGPGGGRGLSITLQDTGAGVVADAAFEVPQGQALVITGSTVAEFSASIASTDVSSQFRMLDGVSPPALPAVPSGASKWVFKAARGAVFDASAFDRDETFDSAGFSVRMQWLRLQPLVFDVIVPYFVSAAVQRLLHGTGYEDRFKLFKGLSLDAMQRVVDNSRAAGVRGMVQYAINLPFESSERQPWEDQAAKEQFSALLDQRNTETQDASEALAIGALDSESEHHDASERFVIGGVYNVAVFDGAFGFL
ncbi:hypothetical protein LRH25_31470 [Ideonella azotifigens]|uniref:Uncharacterized protein n=1 Tax=Ideonella azotifigens TaxID=513160 RepID=A0ABN1K098_9BURK|nr:hypothetical protein [Ideonella azotifigens]MCD2344845.1 hypothetical protein [Ideonella azotifigens]